MRPLDEVFASTGIGEGIVSFKNLEVRGLVVHASNPALIGQHFTPKPELQAAWPGKVTESFDDLDDEENALPARSSTSSTGQRSRRWSRPSSVYLRVEAQQ